jgi:hypothetical protein
MRTSHTLTDKRAKCLNYRNGKRCGRLARQLASGWCSHTSFPYKRPVCIECGSTLVGKDGAEITETSTKGFLVKTSLFGPVSREYKAIA